MVADDALDLADDAEVVGRLVQREQVRKVRLAEELEAAIRPAATDAIWDRRLALSASNG